MITQPDSLDVVQWAGKQGHLVGIVQLLFSALLVESSQGHNLVLKNAFRGGRVPTGVRLSRKSVHLRAGDVAVAVFVDPFEAPPQTLELLRLLELLALLLAPRLLLGDLLINKRTHTRSQLE